MAKGNFPYAPPRELAPHLWEIRGAWTNKFGRRMTVVRLSDSRLIVHNAFRLSTEDLAWLRSLGNPAFILAPNIFHCSDAGWMKEEFPGAELFVPKSKMKHFARQHLEPKDIATEFPSAIATEFKCLPMEGTRIEETAFLHVPSRTLILCDLAFHMNEEFTGFERLIMRWNKVGGRFGPSRLTKLLFTRDRAALLESYRRLLREDFDRVIVNHGEVLEKGGRERLRRGIEEIFGKLP